MEAFTITDRPGGVRVVLDIPAPPPVPAGYSVDGWSWAASGPMPAHVKPVTLQEEIRAWLLFIINTHAPLHLRAMNESGEAVGTTFDLVSGTWADWQDHIPCG